VAIYTITQPPCLIHLRARPRSPSPALPNKKTHSPPGSRTLLYRDLPFGTARDWLPIWEALCLRGDYTNRYTNEDDVGDLPDHVAADLPAAVSPWPPWPSIVASVLATTPIET